MIKLIIFDWDDVITLGSKEGYFQCYHQTLVDLGVKLAPREERQRILAKWGRTHREELQELLKEQPGLLDQACKIYEQKLFSGIFIKSLKLVNGVTELLLRLQKKYSLSVVTGIHPRILKQVMSKFKVPQVFTQIITAYDLQDATKQKPHPYVIQEILKKQKISPQETILVGDAESDISMAQKACVTPVVVLTGHLSQTEAKKLEVQYIIKDVTQLEKVLKLI